MVTLHINTSLLEASEGIAIFLLDSITLPRLGRPTTLRLLPLMGPPVTRIVRHPRNLAKPTYLDLSYLVPLASPSRLGYLVEVLAAQARSPLNLAFLE